MRCSNAFTIASTIALAAAVGATPARAELLDGGVSFQGQFDSNASELGGGVTKEQDFGVSLTPWVRIRSDEGARLRYRVRYETNVRRRFSVVDRDDLDHLLRVQTSYQLTPKTVVRFQQGTDALQDLVRNVRSRSGLPVSEQVPDIFARERRLRMNFALSVERQLDRNTRASISATQSFVRSSDERRFDNSSRGLLFNVNRQLSGKLRVGMGAAATFQETESTISGRGSATDFFRVFGSFSYTIDESLVLSASGGPLFVMPEDRSTLAAGSSFLRRSFPVVFDEDGDARPVDPLSCPTEDGQLFFDPLECEPLSGGIPPVAESFLTQNGRNRVSVLGADQAAKQAESRDSTTISAELALTKTWRHARASMRFSRRVGETADLGTSTVTDTFWTELSWTPDRDWKLTLSGIVSRQDSTNELLLQRPVIIPRILRPFGIVVAQTNGVELLTETDSAADRISFRARLRLQRAIGRHFGSYLELLWHNQKFENRRLSQGRDFAGIQVLFGLSYTFDPRLLRLPF